MQSREIAIHRGTRSYNHRSGYLLQFQRWRSAVEDVNIFESNTLHKPSGIVQSLSLMLIYNNVSSIKSKGSKELSNAGFTEIAGFSDTKQFAANPPKTICL